LIVLVASACGCGGDRKIAAIRDSLTVSTQATWNITGQLGYDGCFRSGSAQGSTAIALSFSPGNNGTWQLTGDGFSANTSDGDNLSLQPGQTATGTVNPDNATVLNVPLHEKNNNLDFVLSLSTEGSITLNGSTYSGKRISSDGSLQMVGTGVAIHQISPGISCGVTFTAVVSGNVTAWAPLWPSACAFASGATTCAVAGVHEGSTYSLPPGCSAAVGLTMQQVGGGNVAHACLNGALPGSCPGAEDPTRFVLGWQADGAVESGPPIGATQSYVMCDAANNCSLPFTVTIADCHTTAVDHLYLDPDQSRPLQVTQCHNTYADLFMDGPWVASDSGVNASSNVVSNLPGANFQISKGFKITDFQVAEQLIVNVPLSAPPGSYLATVATTDSQVARTATIPIEVSACVPNTQAAACNGRTCGTASDGCCGTVTCGPNPCTCVPTSCGARGIACGPTDDGCGHVLNCGGCRRDQECDQGICNPIDCRTGRCM
jgi:hypothetical protein